MAVVLRRTTIFIAIVLAWVLLAAARAPSAAPDREIVAFSGFKPGTIVIKTSERRLYFVLGGDKALALPRSVSAKPAGKDLGRQHARRRQIRPAMARATRTYASIRNLPRSSPAARRTTRWASAALTMAAMANTPFTAPTIRSSIGGFVSHGCIRMHITGAIQGFIAWSISARQ